MATGLTSNPFIDIVGQPTCPLFTSLITYSPLASFSVLWMHTRLVSAVASCHPNAIQLTICELTGANDVANSWATSVSSKSVTMKQAIVGAAIFEFLGAVLVGGRVSSTIKNGIIPANVFQNDAGLQLLGFVNAIFISSRMYLQLLFSWSSADILANSVWLTLATYMSWPVSTTYSIVSAVLGVGSEFRRHWARLMRPVLTDFPS